MDLGAVQKRDWWADSVELAIGAVPRLHSANFLAEALAGARVGLWQVDMLTGEITWDAVTTDLIGRACTKGQSLAFGVHEDDRERVGGTLSRACREGVSHSVEFRGYRGDGEVRWYHALAHPISASAQPLRYYAGIVTDITDRKEAESALRESERQLQSIIASLPGIAYRCELQPPWRMSFISEAVERLTGYSAGEFMEGSIDWESITFPADRELVNDTVARAVEARSRYEFDYRIVTRSGEVRWMRERGGAAYGADGAPLFLEGFVGDVHEQKLAETRLRDAEERYRLISRAAMDATWDLDLETNVLVSNDALETCFGYPKGELRFGTIWWLDKIHPDDRERVSDEMLALMKSDAVQYTSEHRFRRADGSYAEIYVCGYIHRDSTGKAVRMLGAMQDLSARKLADAALRESEAINRSIVEASTDCVLLLDSDAKVLFVNETGARTAGVDDAAVLIGRDWTTLWRREVRRDVRKALQSARTGIAGRFSAGGQTSSGEWRHWDGLVSPVFGPSGAVIKFVAILRDITDRKLAEEKLLWAATRDPLTNLGNRNFFQQKLGEAIATANENGRRMALMLFDLDEFKQVNDSLGHDAGDALLKAFAERLTRACPDASLVARLGGDEFALIIEDSPDGPAIEARALAMLAALREPVVHGGRILDCHATVGSALCPDNAKTPEDLLKNADIALYVAKSTRRGGLVMFEPAHRAELQERLSMISLARTAVRDDRIVPFYQPKINLADGRLHGFEALLRWRHERRGIQLPATITAAFEDLDVAAAISDRIVDGVIRDMRDWLDGGVEFGHVAVNAAAAEFRRDDFAEGLLERLERAGIPPRCFHLEVTETVFLGRGAEYVDRALKVLNSAGVRIALDDFGTGYASLRHLKQFPVHVIKIDQSFVRDMDADPDDAAIIEAVLNLGRSLKIEVVAEGIETPAQEKRLRELGCHYGQGFLYSPAVAAHFVPRLTDYCFGDDRLPARGRAWRGVALPRGRSAA